MSKKIIAVSILMLVIAVLFAACKKDDYEVSFTVPVEDGEDITVFQDKDGNEFVTNVDGDKIPVTTDEDGFYDDVTDLVTATTSTTTKPSNDKTTKPSNDKTTTTTTTKPSNDKTTTTTKPAEPTTGEVIISGEKQTEDSIEWDDIVNAGKN